jgi:serine protease Do
VQAGDVITRFDGKANEPARSLSTTVADADPSEPVDVTVWRNGEPRNLSVQLASSTEMAEARPGGDPRGSRGNQADSAVGLTLRALTDQDKAQLGVPSGDHGRPRDGVEPGQPCGREGHPCRRHHHAGRRQAGCGVSVR